MFVVTRRIIRLHTTYSNQFASIKGIQYEIDSMTNLSPSVLSKIDSNFIQMSGHPIKRVKDLIYEYFGDKFQQRDVSNPVVTVYQNFDDLGFPSDHVGRSLTDSYYINHQWMLRTHMTAHEKEMIERGHQSFLMTGSVFRRDEIDSKHYPVFHQLEGVKIFSGLESSVSQPNSVIESVLSECQSVHRKEEARIVLEDLQYNIDGLLRHLFGPNIPIRWQPCYFPFTQPSLEVEIEYRGKWIEVLGSGILQSSFLESAGVKGRIAWAFGMGLERLAMILFDIPDIRLFWSQDKRFLTQFEPSIPLPIRFKPFSKYPHIARDMSFWIGKDVAFCPNDLYDVIRTVAEDLVESVEQVLFIVMIIYLYIFCCRLTDMKKKT